jgi:histidine triad (HIT) family protein
MKKTLNCDGLNLVQNNGEAAGQTVMHFHLHVIPRYNNDGQHILWKPTSPSPEELTAIRDEILKG